MGEVLSQEEIDALLNSMGADEDEPETADDISFEDGVSSDTAKRDKGVAKKAARIGVPYDFRHPNKFLKEHIENIRVIFDDIAKMWGAILTLKHRMVVQVNMKGLDQMSYEEFLDISQLPTVYGVFPLLDGRSIIGLDRNIAFIMMQNLFGGKNYEMKMQTRNLTDLENQIVGKMFEEMLVHFADSWRRVFSSTFPIESVEANLHPLNLAPLNEIIIRAMMEIKMRDVTGFLVICIPYFCIQSVMDDILNLNQFVTEKTMEVSREYQKILEDKIRNTKIPIHVELGVTDLFFQDLMMLKKGDIIQLKTSVDQPLKLTIGGREKFAVESGNKGKRMSVTVKNFIVPD